MGILCAFDCPAGIPAPCVPGILCAFDCPAGIPARPVLPSRLLLPSRRAHCTPPDDEDVRPSVKSVLADGSVYEGGWGNLGPEGKGRLVLPTGEVSRRPCPSPPLGVGSRVRECFHLAASVSRALLIIRYPRASPAHSCKPKIYKGFFRGGMRSGWGFSSDRKGNEYEGWWAADTLDDEGVLRNATGEAYYGSFRNGLRHGPGTLVRASGEAWSEVWDTGVCVRQAQHQGGPGERGLIGSAGWADAFKAAIRQGPSSPEM